MKKGLLALSLSILLGLSTVSGWAQGHNQKITAWFDQVNVQLDGKPLGFYNQPFVYNGRVYVSINDVANNLGLGLNWDASNKTMYLSDNSPSTLSTLKQQLDQKNMELANLKFQLSQKNVALEILNDSKITSTTSSTTVRDLEDLLEDDYDTHRNDNHTFGFDNYNVSKLSDDTIRVSMYGDFDRTSSYWRNRDKGDFEDFIDDICQEIKDELRGDIQIIVYDEDNNKTAEYTYDRGRSRLYEEYAYGGSSHSDDDLDDLENKLEDDYDIYTNNGRSMKFKDIKVSEYSSEINVKMYGDFDRNDRVWTDRDKDDLQDFVEDLCEDVTDEFDKNVRVYLYDQDRDDLTTFFYDVDDEELRER